VKPAVVQLSGCLLAALLLALPAPANAAQALVAVAANFAVPLETLRATFERDSGHRLSVAIGSTGKLYAQIVHGAPFDVMLAADRERPRRLEAEGHAVAGSRLTYALGRLALWSRDVGRIGADGAAVLRAGKFRRLAMANPDLAPYGAAARQALMALGLYDALRSRIVLGENIGQTFAMVATGNAELGFVALSSLREPDNAAGGSHWLVPAEFHEPIRQDAVLLVHGADNPAAQAFLAYLKSPAAQPLIVRFGYGVE
jgi:molybdate transport system substrate-binding protein